MSEQSLKDEIYRLTATNEKLKRERDELWQIMKRIRKDAQLHIGTSSQTYIDLDEAIWSFAERFHGKPRHYLSDYIASIKEAK